MANEFVKPTEAELEILHVLWNNGAQSVRFVNDKLNEKRAPSVGYLEAQLCQLESIDEGIDCANRIALIDPVIEAFGQQRRLTAIRAFNEPSHRPPP